MAKATQAAAEKKEFKNLQVSLFTNKMKDASDPNDKHPDFLLKHKGKAEGDKWITIGAAWKKTSPKGDFFTVNIDVERIQPMVLSA